MSTIKQLLSKYIENTEQVFSELKLSQKVVYVDREKAKEIVDAARRYLKDAKYYQAKKRFETGLASVAYSEGLLDALRLLKVAEFSWPKRRS
jgi:FAD synthetase